MIYMIVVFSLVFMILIDSAMGVWKKEAGNY